MDLLLHAYSTISDDDEVEDEKKYLRGPPMKRPRPETLSQKKKSPQSFHYSTPQKEALLPGRYVSKREREMLGPSSTILDSTQSSMDATSSVVGSISDLDIRTDISRSLRSRRKDLAGNGKLPESLSTVLNSHTKAVNAIQWSPTHAHLLASAGMDTTVYVWNVWSRSQKQARVFNYHGSAVKYLRWSQDGLSLLSCGYDCSLRLVDVEKGIQTQTFKEDQVVGTLKFHPGDSNLFLSGGSKGFLRLWDIRVGMVVQEYMRNLGPILDIEFSIDAKQVVSSSDISGSNASENSIIVWDVLRQVPLSNQVSLKKYCIGGSDVRAFKTEGWSLILYIRSGAFKEVYVEAYTCPCIKYHPVDPYFVAQSNGNYIAIFSGNPPFRLDKYKRYENHQVSGFPIKCDFSLDGKVLASGSSDGCIYLYNYKSSQFLGKLRSFEQACVDVAFHPTLPNVIASCSWSGDISVFE